MPLRMPVVLDTHAWIWWVAEDRRLSERAQAAIREAHGDRSLWISRISIWEIAKKVEKGRLVLDRALDDWLDLATDPAGLRVAEPTRSVLVESCRLPDGLDGDPADQMIVATARAYGAVLVTKDRRLRKYQHVRTVW